MEIRGEQRDFGCVFVWKGGNPSGSVWGGVEEVVARKRELRM